MDKLKLVRPSRAMRAQAEDYRREFFDHGEREINGSARLDQLDFDRWLERLEGTPGGPGPTGPWWTPTSPSGRRTARWWGLWRSATGWRPTIWPSTRATSATPSGPASGGGATPPRCWSWPWTGPGSWGWTGSWWGATPTTSPSRTVIQRCGGQLAEVKPYLNGKPMYVFWITL